MRVLRGKIFLTTQQNVKNTKKSTRVNNFKAFNSSRNILPLGSESAGGVNTLKSERGEHTEKSQRYNGRINEKSLSPF